MRFWTRSKPKPDAAGIPDRSMRSTQDGLAAWCGLAVLGLVIAAIGFSGDNRFLMPGPISTSHSSVEDCAGCHANLGKGQLGWLHALVKATSPERDSAACLTCHKLDDGAMQPHGIPANEMRAKTDAAANSSNVRKVAGSASVVDRLRAYLLPAGKISKEKVYCATCHKEHRNKKIGMTAMSDNRCQTCHTVQFTRFDKDHPEFKAYPFSRRTRIKFNHASHMDKNFSEWQAKNPDVKGPPQTCAGCHTPTADQKHMSVKPFEKTCASCHAGQIVGKGRASGPQGVALLALPGLDLRTIDERGFTVGEWPAGSEAELPPLTKLLLGGSKQRRALLAKVAKLDLLDLTKSTREETEAVVRLAWEIKRLLYGLTAAKASEVMRRLGRITGVGVDHQLMTKLIATLPRDVLMGAQRDWLPNLTQEVERLHKVGWDVATRKAKPKRSKAAKNKSAKAKLAAVKKEPPPDRLATNPKFGRWVINIVGDLVQEGDKASAPVLSDGNDKPTEATGNEETKPDEEQSVEPAGKAVTRLAISSEQWAEFGGWYRKDFAILYKPIGHADPFMRAWLDFSGSAQGLSGQNLAAPVFELLTAKDAQGQCIKCHSLDSSSTQTGSQQVKHVQWGASSADNKQRRFTKFTHEPHFQLLDVRGCLTCHQMRTAKNFERTYQSLDPHISNSNFKQVEKQVCAACHKTNAARQDCLLCHAYHVTPVRTPITATKLPSRK